MTLLAVWVYDSPRLRLASHLLANHGDVREQRAALDIVEDHVSQGLPDPQSDADPRGDLPQHDDAQPFPCPGPESDAMQRPEEVVAILSRLKALGVGISGASRARLDLVDAFPLDNLLDQLAAQRSGPEYVGAIAFA